MDMREEENKEIEMPSSTLGYNLPNRNSSSSKLSSSSPTLVGERRDQPPPPPPPPPPTHHQTRSLIFSDPIRPQTSHHHHLYPPPSLPPNPLQLPEPHRRRRDPDPTSVSLSPPIAITNTTTNNPRTAPPPQPQPQITGITKTIRYRECLKNHAASMGGHVTDGCGEFMPNGEEGTPESFKCAACECHRNFHRKEAEGESSQHVFIKNNVHQNRTINIHSPPPPPQSHLQFPTPHSSLQQPHRLSSSYGVVATPLIQPMMMGFGGCPAESISEDLNMFQPNDGGPPLSVQPSISSSKKRFRTKFTQEQKDRMMEFAEKLGWRIQKQDDQEVHQFCSQVGIKRQVFKVWMHNSKQAMKKKQM